MEWLSSTIKPTTIAPVIEKPSEGDSKDLSKSATVRSQVLTELSSQTLSTNSLRELLIQKTIMNDSDSDSKILKNQIGHLFADKEICKLGEKIRGGEWALAKEAEKYRKKGIKVTFSENKGDE